MKTTTTLMLGTMVLTMACGKPPCNVDYVTQQGINVCGSGLVDTQEIETTLQAIEKLLNISNLQKKLAKNGVTIEFVTTSTKLPADADGVAIEDDMLAVVTVWPCLADSSLIHEVLHLVEFAIWNKSCGDHDRPGFFKGEFSAQYVVAEQLRQELPSCQ